MSKKAIICVDDEAMILTSLHDQLQRHFGDRYVYEFAESADEALELIEELVAERMEILIIVSDWLMPGMKGDELLLLVHQRFPDIITVMLTGQADDGIIEHVQAQVGLFRCLRKPWTEDELIATLAEGLP